MISGVCTDREGQFVAIHNRESLHALLEFRETQETHMVSAALCNRKRGIDETLAFIERAFVPQRIDQLSEGLTQYLQLTPLLEPAMDGFVVGIALRQELPFRASVQNPEYSFQNGPSGNGFSARPTIREVFLRKMFANAVPLIISQPQYTRIYMDGNSCRQLF